MLRDLCAATVDAARNSLRYFNVAGCDPDGRIRPVHARSYAPTDQGRVRSTLPENVRGLRFSARTIRPRTEHAFATTSMSATSQSHTAWPSSVCAGVVAISLQIVVTDAAIRYSR